MHAADLEHAAAAILVLGRVVAGARARERERREAAHHRRERFATGRAAILALIGRLGSARLLGIALQSADEKLGCLGA